jgi:protein disulfide-isomerase
MNSKPVLFAILLLGSLTLFAQPAPAPVAPAVRATPATVTAENLTWYTSLEQAQTAAQAKNLPILIDFTGSDWCIWCKRLGDEVFSQPEFKAYTNTSMILVRIDFPRGFRSLPAEEQQYRKDLQERFAIEGYPTVILTDAKGVEIARTGYQEGGAASYVTHLKGLLAEPKGAK